LAAFAAQPPLLAAAHHVRFFKSIVSADDSRLPLTIRTDDLGRRRLRQLYAQIQVREEK